MRDLFTLVVPTYNRPESLGRLLRFLEANDADFRIRVLDSSREGPRRVNRQLVEASRLACEYVEFDLETHPFDKFRAGVDGVGTPFSCLCADDDILLPDGLRASVAFLEDNPEYSVAHGYYFQFMLHEAEMRLTAISYYTPSYDDTDPIARVHHLMRHYQALTYGVYRTETLHHVFATVTPVKSLLARELLSSALASVDGKVARLPMLYHGRNLGPSSGHVNWHPLEWFIRNPQELFSEYGRYRDLLAEAIVNRARTDRTRSEVERILDLVHMQYFVRHAPDEVFDFIVREALAGRDADAIFSTHIVGVALWRAAEDYAPLGKLARRSVRAAGSLPALARAIWPVRLARAVDSVSPTMGHRLRRVGKRALGLTSPAADSAQGAATPPAPRTLSTRTRRYVLAPGFSNPPSAFGVTVTDGDVERLIVALDAYC